MLQLTAPGSYTYPTQTGKRNKFIDSKNAFKESLGRDYDVILARIDATVFVASKVLVVSYM